MRHVLVGVLLTMVMLLFLACESLLRVDTFNKQYAAGMTGVQAVYTVTAAAVESGRISKEEGRDVTDAELDRINVDVAMTRSRLAKLLQ